MVCLSRISPIRMQSGACRRAFFSATSKLLVSLPTSRWLTMDFLLVKMNSTGSSSVRMWPDFCSLRRSSMAESEVDLPEPVAPTMRIRPRFCMMISFRISGNPSESIAGMLPGMKRTTTAGEPFWRKALMRKLPTPSREKAVFSSISSSYSLTWRSVRTSYSNCCTVSGVIMVWLTGTDWPLILMLIGEPTDRKMSDAFLSAITWNRRFIADMCSSASR